MDSIIVNKQETDKNNNNNNQDDDDDSNGVKKDDKAVDSVSSSNNNDVVDSNNIIQSIDTKEEEHIITTPTTVPTTEQQTSITTTTIITPPQQQQQQQDDNILKKEIIIQSPHRNNDHDEEEEEEEEDEVLSPTQFKSPPPPPQPTTPTSIVTPQLHLPTPSGKYLPLTPHLSKFDQLRMISELEHQSPHDKLANLEALLIEKNQMILSPEKSHFHDSNGRLTPPPSFIDDLSSSGEIGNSSDSLFGSDQTSTTSTSTTQTNITSSTNELDTEDKMNIDIGGADSDDTEDDDFDMSAVTLELGKSFSSVSTHSESSSSLSQSTGSAGNPPPLSTLPTTKKEGEGEETLTSTTTTTTTTTTKPDQPTLPKPPLLVPPPPTTRVKKENTPKRSTSTTSSSSTDIGDKPSSSSSKADKLLSFLGFVKKKKNDDSSSSSSSSGTTTTADQNISGFKEEYIRYLDHMQVSSKNEEKVKFEMPKASVEDGHVFLLYGDLTKLVCDVKMVPCSNHSMMRVALSSWLKNDWLTFPADIRNKVMMSVPPEPFKRGISRVYKCQSWPTEYPNISQPWFTTVVPNFHYYERIGPEWYISGAREFLNEVGKDLAKNKPKPKNGRAKHLVALPILGTGGGGGSSIAGSILSLLLQELYKATRVWKYDCVLVTNELPMYTAARNARREMMSQDKDYSYIYNQLLGDQMMEKASQLAKMLDQGKLALFLGAGCSRSAGLPTWIGLLNMLGEKLGMTQDEVKAMDQLHYLDRATVLENRWKKALAKYSPPTVDDVTKRTADKSSSTSPNITANAEDGAENPLDYISNTVYSELHRNLYNEINIPMQEEIANLMKVSHAGLTHFLMASTPATDIITTNYDRCFEIASTSVGTSCVVLPYESLISNSDHKKRWILKLHGCVSNPMDIVITREDYIRYGDKREALSGILQSSLITKHLLFVGFSLVDDNFFNVMSAVKSATFASKQQRKFGTALFIQKNDLMSELWGQQIDFVCLDKGNEDIARCARKQEIFLEYLSSISINNTSHLMEQRFDCILKEGEKVFRDSLIKFVEDLPEEARETQVYKKSIDTITITITKVIPYIMNRKDSKDEEEKEVENEINATTTTIAEEEEEEDDDRRTYSLPWPIIQRILKLASRTLCTCVNKDALKRAHETRSEVSFFEQIYTEYCQLTNITPSEDDPQLRSVLHKRLCAQQDINQHSLTRDQLCALHQFNLDNGHQPNFVLVKQDKVSRDSCRWMCSMALLCKRVFAFISNHIFTDIVMDASKDTWCHITNNNNYCLLKKPKTLTIVSPRSPSASLFFMNSTQIPFAKPFFENVEKLYINEPLLFATPAPITLLINLMPNLRSVSLSGRVTESVLINLFNTGAHLKSINLERVGVRKLSTVDPTGSEDEHFYYYESPFIFGSLIQPTSCLTKIILPSPFDWNSLSKEVKRNLQVISYFYFSTTSDADPVLTSSDFPNLRHVYVWSSDRVFKLPKSVVKFTFYVVEDRKSRYKYKYDHNRIDGHLDMRSPKAYKIIILSLFDVCESEIKYLNNMGYGHIGTYMRSMNNKKIVFIKRDNIQIELITNNQFNK
ncbi:hypothetical protein DFA_11827 [Cavenderia fasciculata]|uniref:SIR2-like domain-containing protein n=1 Tax=Cavenderia fasciculata TaxID=261658 RepID=F4QEB7_CACFS|nr:uncharacterized protein DFA_11827 [Cavenderia fasciculata]EGG14064.1 hypothetical protein DFA_11827 [Cavenderia fasciculata]|eukprot:XP_004350772.1 hypothetical protein DFA_11827 [Cavenderia fasciculata]